MGGGCKGPGWVLLGPSGDLWGGREKEGLRDLKASRDKSEVLCGPCEGLGMVGLRVWGQALRGGA